MFGWISDRFASSDDRSGALGSPRTARALIARLASESPQYALDEIAKQFHAAPRDALATPRGAHALQLLDEWAQAPLALLWGSLLADNLGQAVRDANWSTLSRYYRRTFLAHANGLGLGHANDTQPPQANGPIAAVRAMTAFRKYVLLQRLRYLAVAEESWTYVWRLIGWADAQQVAATPVEPYARSARTTVEREFLSGLLIEVAPTANLLPGQIIGLEHWLHLHADGLRRADRFDAQATPFAYQPGSSEPPQRYLQGLRLRDGTRFFGPGAAYAAIRKARDQAGAVELPEWLARVGCNQETYIELLDRLGAHWAPEPPRRRHPRESRSGEMRVAQDLPTIRLLVKFSELAVTGQSLSYDAADIYKVRDSLRTCAEAVHAAPLGAYAVSVKEALANLTSFEKTLEPGATQTWAISDCSESGIGACVQPDCSWVKVGMVIAFRLADSADWQVAVVRRLSRGSQGPLHIGLARLGGKVRSARLRRGIAKVDYTGSMGAVATEIEYDAISFRETTLSLLLPPGVFDQTQKYTLTCENRQQVIKMEKSLERRPNFECVEVSEIEMLRAA